VLDEKAHTLTGKLIIYHAFIEEHITILENEGKSKNYSKITTTLDSKILRMEGC
jgi:hypothetical protein